MGLRILFYVRNTLKVGATINAKLVPENADPTGLTYQWSISDSATGTFTNILGATTASYVASESDKDKYIKVTVTNSEGATFEAVTTAPVVLDNTATVTITDASGFQADGTALAGDVLSVTYGSALGIPQGISWYANDVVVKTEDFTGTSGKFTLVTDKTAGTSVDFVLAEGTANIYCIITAKDGQQYQSEKTIVLTAKEEPVTAGGFAVVDDYETPTIAYTAEDTDALVAITLSKDVAGDLYIYKDAVTKYGKDNAIAVIAKEDFDNTVQVTAKTSFTTKEAFKQAATTVSGKDMTGICYREADGSIDFLIVGNDTGISGTKFKPTRGTSYKAVFDQTNISTDDVKTTASADLKPTEPSVAAYVTAPAKIVLTKHVGGEAPKVTMYDDKDEVMSFIANTKVTAPTLASMGIASLITYDEVANAKAKKNKATQGAATIAEAEKGVLTGDQALGAAATYGYYWAYMKTVKGVYAATALELESEIVAGSEAPYAVMNIVDKDKDNPKTAVVTFSKLKVDGTVYVVEGSAGKATAADIAKTLDVDDPSTYTAKATVTKGASKVEIENAIQSYADSVAVDATNGTKYVAVFKPVEGSEYTDGYPTTFLNTKYTVKDAESSNNLTLVQIPTSIKVDGEAGKDTATVIGGPIAYDKTATVSDTLEGSKILAYDQFGDKIISAVEATTVDSITPINKTLTTTEDANAKYEIKANGPVWISLYRGTNVDANDGFTVTILGTAVKFVAPWGANNPATAATDAWEVTIGTDKIADAKGGAAGSATITFAKFTADIDTTTTGIYTIVNADKLATGATIKLESSTDGSTWSAVTNGTINDVSAGTTATDVDIKANTYYRLEIAATGAGTQYVNMDGKKTDAQTAASVSWTDTASVTAGTATTLTSYAQLDQFGDAMGTSTALTTTAMTGDAGNTANIGTLSVAIDGTGKVTLTSVNGTTVKDIGAKYTASWLDGTITATATTASTDTASGADTSSVWTVSFTAN